MSEKIKVLIKFKGCVKNLNNFATKEECLYQCRVQYNPHEDRRQVTYRKAACLEAPEETHCRYRNQQEYYFNVDKQDCSSYKEYGCGKSGNTFSSRRQCQRKCVNSAWPTVQERCGTYPDFTDQCDEYGHKSYYFNPRANSCQRSSSGVCSKNENGFETIEECEHECLDRSVMMIAGTRCTETPEASDDCQTSYSGYFYYFDWVTGNCRTFPRRQCGANGNNFKSKEHCQYECQYRKFFVHPSEIIELKYLLGKYLPEDDAKKR